MATAAKIEDAKPSRHFMSMLEALLNSSSEEYEERLAEVLDYVGACENNANITALQASVAWSLRSQERQRKAIKKELAKLPRFTDEKQNDLGDWVSFYAMMEVVR